MAIAAAAARSIYCEISPENLGTSKPRRRPTEDGKIVLQPRVCTLRSYGSGSRDGRGGSVVRAPPRGGDGGVSPFLASLAEYIESSRKSQDFEIVSGRLAMIAFATAVSVEVITGNSIFRKLDLQQIAEAAGVCLAVVASAAVFAWFSSNRRRIGKMFTLSCNSFVDSLIDNLIDGLFCDIGPADWSDEI